MDRRKIICVVVIILVLSIAIYKPNINKVNKNEEIKEEKQSTKVNRKQFAMYIKENGEYKEYTSSDTFPEGYVIDESMSKCYDAENQEIEGITFVGNSNNITVTSGKTAYCYLYFDEAGRGGLEILDNLPANSGLSASKLGDMRRYQESVIIGFYTNNFICINDTGTDCYLKSNEMYRIIGIIEDGPEAGQIKVMKQTSIGNYSWNKAYRIGTEIHPEICGKECPTWENSDLANMLNTTFLNSLPTKVQNVIVSRQWYYGDLSNFDTVSSVDAFTMFQKETGQLEAGYYDMDGNDFQKKWQKTNKFMKIGLINLHDYYWQSIQNNCHYNLDANAKEKCKRYGWMHMDNNEIIYSDENEWTMSRVFNSSGLPSEYVDAWGVRNDGAVSDYTLNYQLAVRPVFYLSSTVRIKKGTGSQTNPYILDLS